MPDTLACLTKASAGGNTRFSCNTDSIVWAVMGSSCSVERNGNINARDCKDIWRAASSAGIMLTVYLTRRASPHCMVVNLVRSGRKQPQLFSASAGGKARHHLTAVQFSSRCSGEGEGVRAVQ